MNLSVRSFITPTMTIATGCLELKTNPMMGEVGLEIFPGRMIFKTTTKWKGWIINMKAKCIYFKITKNGIKVGIKK